MSWPAPRYVTRTALIQQDHDAIRRHAMDMQLRRGGVNPHDVWAAHTKHGSGQQAAYRTHLAVLVTAKQTRMDLGYKATERSLAVVVNQTHSYVTIQNIYNGWQVMVPMGVADATFQETKDRVDLYLVSANINKVHPPRQKPTTGAFRQWQ